MQSEDIKKVLASHGIKFIEKKVLAYKGAGNRVTTPKDWGKCDVIIIKPEESRGVIEIMEEMMDELDVIKKACSRMCDRFKDFNFDCNEEMNLEDEKCRKCPYGVNIMKLKMKFSEVSTHFSEEEMDKRILREFDKIRDGPML